MVIVWFYYSVDKNLNEPTITVDYKYGIFLVLPGDWVLFVSAESNGVIIFAYGLMYATSYFVTASFTF